ncbi:MAG: hypothetical protein LN563_00955 [Rickettsia endosymbiont of Platyusa sonomae]|nr:hypothetical protein [Rickettsia endosymbiont of Platyusa sonomae]
MVTLKILSTEPRKNYIFPDDPNGETMDQLLIKEYNKLLSAHNMPPIGYCANKNFRFFKQFKVMLFTI